MTTLQSDLDIAMEAALQAAPRPAKMSQADYARHVVDALALKALQRAEYKRALAEQARAAEAEAVAFGRRYFVCAPYLGISVDVREDETQAFADWAGVKHGDLVKMLRGQQLEAGEFRYDLTLWKRDSEGNFIRPSQLAVQYVAPAVKSGTVVKDSMRLTRAMLALVLCNWRSMSLPEAVKYAADRRQPLPAGAVIASN
jgi:hypothetical protein